MTTQIAEFGAPQDVTPSGLDGRAYRFPFALISGEHVGTPRQKSATKHCRITVEASRSLITVWDLSEDHLVKARFQVAKEHLVKLLEGATSIDAEIKVAIHTRTHRGRCPFDISLIEELDGSVVQFEVARPIGFARSA